MAGLLKRRRRALGLLLVAAATSGVACNYSFQAGAGLQGIRTLAIVPFENDTDRLELTDEIYNTLLQELPRALGMQLAGEDAADAVVEGVITSYNVTAPNYRPDPTGGRPEVLQREVSIAVQVRIVNLNANLILWEQQALRGQGQYLEASEREETGRALAIEMLVQKIVDGAQSNW